MPVIEKLCCSNKESFFIEIYALNSKLNLSNFNSQMLHFVTTSSSLRTLIHVQLPPDRLKALPSPCMHVLHLFSL